MVGQKQRFNTAEKDLGAKEKMLKNWETNMKGAVARGIAAAAKVKTDPTPASYNAIFPKAARDITMQLVFARDIQNLKADAKTVQSKLDPWANNPSALALTTTPKDALEKLKEFIGGLKLAKELLENRS